MTFQEFIASRTSYSDLRQCPDFQGDDPQPGLGYGPKTDGFPSLFIELVTPDWPQAAQDQGCYDLILGNAEYTTDDLPLLEQKLYQFAVDEGYAS